MKNTLKVTENTSREEVLRQNGRDKSRLYRLWKQDLGTDGESKLPQLIFLTEYEMARKMAREKVLPFDLLLDKLFANGF
jgi:hypothetical protein